MNAPKQKAVCGTWPSPISAAMVAAGSAPLGQVATDGGDIYWLAGRPSEGGRNTLLRLRGGTITELTPAPFNVRSRVHEYGGGAFHVADGTAWFTHHADNVIYAVHGDAAPAALTRAGKQRHADFVWDRARHRLLSVREDHSAGGHTPVNTLCAIAADGSESVLVEGADFYSSPRLSPDGRKLAWLSWNLPRMPWQGTELWLADVRADGALANAHIVAGGPDESICQPEWSAAGALHFVSDRGGWWNLFVLVDNAIVPLCERAAEFGQPHWVFGNSMYAFRANGDIVCSYIENGASRLALLAGGKLTPIANRYEEIREVHVAGDAVVFVGGAPVIAPELVRLPFDGAAPSVLAQSASAPDASTVSVPQAISFPTGPGGAATAHAFFYPPTSSTHAPLGKPPLIVIIHGGPTGMATNTLNLKTQFWTSRGFAVLDVNYRGSTGFGRAYRDALKGQWGVADVEDCVAGAQTIAMRGLADPERLLIRGGSAGGFTTLSALIFHDVFKAGACYYGVSDLQGLDDDSHKFEAGYNAYLIAPQPQAQEIYLQRSPIHHKEKLRHPMIFFQGLDDKVVPPQQSEAMVQALRDNGVPVHYVTLEGEGHGFRKAESIVATLEAELQFYRETFGLA